MAVRAPLSAVVSCRNVLRPVAGRLPVRSVFRMWPVASRAPSDSTSIPTSFGLTCACLPPHLHRNAQLACAPSYHLRSGLGSLVCADVNATSRMPHLERIRRAGELIRLSRVAHLRAVLQLHAVRLEHLLRDVARVHRAGDARNVHDVAIAHLGDLGEEACVEGRDDLLAQPRPGRQAKGPRVSWRWRKLREGEPQDVTPPLGWRVGKRGVAAR